MESHLPERVELTQTPFFAQSDYQCGPAALAMLLGAAGVPATPEALVREIYLPDRHGSLQPELVGALRARGFVPYVLQPELPALLLELAAGRPVLVLQRQGLGPWPAWHYAVAVGYDAAADQVLLRSGKHPQLALSSGQFEATWTRAGRWAVIALPPGQLPAQPDLANYLAAVAGLEARGPSPQAARAAYAAAISHWPGESMPRFGLANVDAAAGDWQAAARGYSEALALAPQDVAVQNNLAEAFRHLGCLHAASTTVASALHAAPQGHALHDTVQDTARSVAADAERAQAAGLIEPASCHAFQRAGAEGVP